MRSEIILDQVFRWGLGLNGYQDWSASCDISLGTGRKLNVQRSGMSSERCMYVKFTPCLQVDLGVSGGFCSLKMFLVTSQ